MKSWIILFLTGLLAGPALAQTIKIGSIAPDRSPWNDGMKEMARQWEQISNGAVKLKIYAGGIAGSEDDMVRKMRVGTLGGALLTNIGMTEIYRDSYVLNTPFLFSSETEFRHVLERMKPIFEKQIEERGFKVILWSSSGWVNFFTKGPVLYPEDMKKYKLSFSTGEPEMEQVWKKAGYQIVPNDLNDLMMGLESGMVNAFYLPPLLAGSGQYFPLAPHMLSLQVAPLVGGIVINKKVWDAIPQVHQAPMIAATIKIANELTEKIANIEKKTLETMKQNGLIVHELPADALAKWRNAVALGMDELIGKAFSKEIYDQMIKILNEYRQKNDSPIP